MKNEAHITANNIDKSLPLLSLFELRYQTKQISFWILAAVMAAYGVLITIDHLGEGMSQLQSNSPYRLSYFISLTSSLSVIIISLLCINAFMRDNDSGFHQLVGHLKSTKQRQAQLLSVTGLAIAMVSLITIAMAFGLLSPNLVGEIGEDKIAAFNLNHYLKPWLVFVLPNSIIISLILSAISIRFQNTFFVYTVALLLIIFFLFSILIIGAPITGTPVSARESTLIIASLIDPFGAAAFFEQTALMSVETKNQQSVELSGLLLANRILWLCGAIFIYAICQNKQSKAGQRKADIAHKKANFKKNKIKLKNKHSTSPLSCKSADEQSFSFSLSKVEKNIPKILNIIIFNTHFEIKSLLKDNTFKVAMLFWSAMVLVGITMVDKTFVQAEMVDQLATTAQLISHCAEAFSGLALFYVIYFCSDTLWHANTVKMAGLIETTPVSNLALDSTKLLSLFVIPSIMLLVLMVIAGLYQLIIASHLVDLLIYFSMFIYLVLPVCIKACTIFFIQLAILHSRISNKYLAMVLSGLFIFSLPVILASIGVQNPLILFNQIPDVLRSYSEFDGYGLVGESAQWLTLYWGLFAVVIARLAFTLNQRNDEHSVSFVNDFSGRKNKLGFTFLFLGILTCSSIVLHQLPDTKYDRSKLAKLNKAHQYELLYKHYQNIIQPVIVHTDTTIEHYPSSNSIQVETISTLKNTSTESIKRILLTSKRAISVPKITGAQLIKQISTGFWHAFEYELSNPMKQNDILELSYSMFLQSTPFNINGHIKANGSYLHQGQVEPMIGYVSAIEIQSNFQRKKRGLALLNISADKFSQQTNTVKRTFNTKLVTSKDMHALTIGKLSHQGLTNNRNIYQYEINQPVFSMVGYFFAKYKKQSFHYGKIPIDVFYHKSHDSNILEMVRAAKLTMEYMQAEFGDYPYDSLKLVETTQQTPFGGRASAGVIALNESLFTQNPKGKVNINNVVRNTIHEVVHQWFGEKLAAREGKGQKVIHESIAKYLEAEILAIAESQKMADKLMTYNFRRYLSGRSYANKKEVPLSESQNENYLFYGKGPIVFKAIQNKIGKERLHLALRTLIERNIKGTDATFEQMLTLILEQTPTDDKQLVRYWLTQVYDLKNLMNKNESK